MAGSRQDADRSVRSGRFVKESTGERDPRRTITEKVRANTSDGMRVVHRSVATGRFVKPGESQGRVSRER